LEGRKKTGYAKLALHISCGQDMGTITKGGGLAIHFRGEAHSFVCFAGLVEESEAEKYSEKTLSLAADDVFGNYWWYPLEVMFFFFFFFFI
jgi:hypothetical protein